jgi:hypothetical protein
LGIKILGRTTWSITGKKVPGIGQDKYISLDIDRKKRCGDFDNEISLGVYICEDYIKNEKTRNHFFSNYDKSTKVRTK